MDKCSDYMRTVARNYRAIECDTYKSWCYIQCGKVSSKSYYDMMNTSNLRWNCPTCLLNTQSNLKVDEPMFDHNYQDSDTDVYKELRTTLGNKNLKIGHKWPLRQAK